MELAVVAQQLVPEPRMLSDEVREHLTDRGSLGRDRGLAAGRGAQDRGQPDVYGHGISIRNLHKI